MYDIEKQRFLSHHGFKYRAIESILSPTEQKRQINTMTHNAIFFQLEGILQVSWGEHRDTIINPGEFFFLPRGVEVSACILSDSIKYIAVRLDHELEIDNPFNDLFEECENSITYKFAPLQFRGQMGRFIEMMKLYIIDGADSVRLHDIKVLELFMLLRSYYTAQECTNLFHPILKKSSKFKTYILNNYRVSVSIDELAEQANMSRSTFDRTFKKHFNTTPHKWIDTQTRTLILRKSAEPNTTVKDIMFEVGIDNPSQFTHLCKRLCGEIPSKLLLQ